MSDPIRIALQIEATHSSPVLKRPESSAATALAEDEDAWCRHEAFAESIRLIHEWIRQRKMICSASGSPLADEEDAWARQ